MTITCTVCGTVNPEGTTYCEGCGVELTAQQAAAPTPEAVSAPGTPIETPAHVDGDLTDPATASVPESPAVQMPDSPELAAGVPDMPITDAPEAGAPASLPVDDTPSAPAAAVENDPAPVAAAVPVATTSDPTTAPSDAPAKLGIKKYGAPTGEFIPLHGEHLVVGRFDASSGPVDIDLTGMGGQEHISRRHAELYREGGAWMVRDLGS
uniref:FHA domain-containing protein n=1 Tax=Deinococcus sp. TaxID=47478 RepID=UPI002869C11F